MASYRLYLVLSDTGKSTGKKRDYPSLDHFYKYGIDTYKRYNEEYYYSGKTTGTKAKLCFLNKQNKWEQVNDKYIEQLLNR